MRQEPSQISVCMFTTRLFAKMSLVFGAVALLNGAKFRAVTAFSGSFQKSSRYSGMLSLPSFRQIGDQQLLRRKNPENENGIESWRLFSTSSISSEASEALKELKEKISAKGDEIRDLKAGGIDKEALAPHIEELLALKAQLPDDDPSATKKSTPKKKKGKGGKQNTKKAKKPEEPMSESEIKLTRLAKVESMREANIEPFEYTFDVTTSAAQLQADYNDKLEPGEEDEESDVGVAGRILTRRVFGKLAFFTMQDESGIVQLQFDKKRLGDTFKVRAIFFTWCFDLS